MKNVFNKMAFDIYDTNGTNGTNKMTLVLQMSIVPSAKHLHRK